MSELGGDGGGGSDGDDGMTAVAEAAAVGRWRQRLRVSGFHGRPTEEEIHLSVSTEGFL